MSERNDFIRQIIRNDLASGAHATIRTRFPPEPNGYLHIGHAKSILLNFGVAAEFGGVCNLRFDDTNPAREDAEYVEAIKEDIAWLGHEWHLLRHASDYFEVFYRAARKLVREGHAFVCDLSAEQVREYRGTLTEPGRDSPCRDRSVEENLDLLARMRAGEFADGSRTLRAKIDMASGNINLRDPAIYRIRRMPHQNVGEAWCIYPMYDFAHCMSDAIEGITHSLCTLEFEDHRPLYDWYVDRVDLPGNPELWQPLVQAGLEVPVGRPRQIEFARLNIDYTVMSKRKLTELVREGLVDGWDDPRLPTLRGLRRRGVTPGAIGLLIDRIGISKQNSLIEYGLLEGCVREDLEAHTLRRMAVLDVLKLVITNLPPDHEERVAAPNHPQRPELGGREIAFGPELWIEREDFAEVPPKGFRRLVPGGEVRLRHVGIVRCEQVVKDDRGELVELRCTLDPDSRPGRPAADRKVKGTLHWVSARHGVQAEVRLYDRLFTVPDPDQGPGGYRDHLNPDSKRVVADARLEPVLAQADPEQVFQFERLGYFVADRRDHGARRPVFNRTVTLRDVWARAAGRT
ncbi:MAG TPA: glutamine--tRNA ligase/YqeY domain fusion protein [Xanthomonadaceae bacterium]|nr:glutamine--tRNA ligase/YqeY domain fusion protein [Xanthomonadaceae bacterium]